MKILFFSDWHLHNYQQFSHILPNGRNSRLQDCVDIAEQANLICQEEEIDHVVFLGDLFHSRTRIETNVLAAAREAMVILRKRSKLFLVGNHDQFTKSGEDHILDLFTKHSSDICDSPLRAGIAGMDIVACPYTTDIDDLKNTFKDMEPCDLLLFHQGIKEATVGPYDMKVNAELNVEDFPQGKFKLAIGGHYHKGQMVRKDIIYVGSPLQLSFGERGEFKGFVIVEKDEHGDIKWRRKESFAPTFHWFDSPDDLIDSICAKDHNLDLAKDFIRVTCENQEQANALKKEHPQLQVDVANGIVKTSKRISTEASLDDSKLLSVYVEREAHKGFRHSLLKKGLQLLNNED